MPLKIKNILVPIDFSDLSIRAIPAAKRFAQRLGSRIHLGNVREPWYPAFFYGMGPQPPLAVTDSIEIAQRNAASRLKQLAEEYQLTGRTHTTVGAPVFAEICSIAQDISADLIVTPTHGHTGFKHLFLGSTAERVVQHAPCPVLVVRARRNTKTTPQKISTILVPTDFSSCALGGLRYAIQLAERFNARIVVLHVVDLGSDAYGIYELSTYRERLEAEARKRLSSFLRRVQHNGVKMKGYVVTGEPVEEICQAVAKQGADMIVTATHGRTGLRHALIGSTAEVIVRHSPCPVLVVPSHPVQRRERLRTFPTQKKRPIRRRKAARTSKAKSLR